MALRKASRVSAIEEVGGDAVADRMADPKLEERVAQIVIRNGNRVSVAGAVGNGRYLPIGWGGVGCCVGIGTEG